MLGSARGMLELAPAQEVQHESMGKGNVPNALWGACVGVR